MMEDTKQKAQRKRRGQQSPQRNQPAAEAAGETTSSTSAGALSGIIHPGINDVMFGRGGDTNYHIGNNSFRHLVESYQDEYWEASNRKEKSDIIAAIVNGWRNQNPPGRFLAKSDPTLGEGSLWHDVGDQVAGRKASKILSEMRIGKKKGAAGKRKRESPAPAPEEESYDFSAENFFETLSSNVAMQMPMPGYPQQQQAAELAMAHMEPNALQPPGLARNISVGGFGLPSHARISASPLIRGDMATYDESVFAQQQQDETKEPPIDYKLASAVPVAASLTDVFQDQYAPGENVGRKESSSDESHK